LQFVAIFPAKVVAGGEVGSSFVVFPNLMVLRPAWHPAQRTLFKDIALCITIQFQEAGFQGAVVPIGENNQNLALHFGGQYSQEVRLPPQFSSYGARAIGWREH
jgi:hypothetical protein